MRPEKFVEKSKLLVIKFILFFTYSYCLQVAPGYLRTLVPEQAPEQGEDWRTVMKDVERVIMPGVTHWHHPQVNKI